MNCLTIDARRVGDPIILDVENRNTPVNIIAGLVCSMDDSPASIISKDGMRLISKDGFVLFSKKD